MNTHTKIFLKALVKATDKGLLDDVKEILEPLLDEQCSGLVDTLQLVEVALAHAKAGQHDSIVAYLTSVLGGTEEVAHGLEADLLQAVRLNDYNKVKSLVNRGARSVDALDAAAESGNLDIVRLLHDAGNGCTFRALYWAATNGHLDVVRYLVEHSSSDCPAKIDEGTIVDATLNGHLDVAEYLLSNGGPRTDKVVAAMEKMRDPRALEHARWNYY